MGRPGRRHARRALSPEAGPPPAGPRGHGDDGGGLSRVAEALLGAAGADPALRRAVEAFLQRVGSFAYTPQDRGAADRLLSFSTDPPLVAALRDALRAARPRRHELGDLIPFWCAVACLAQDGSEPSAAALGDLVRELDATDDAGSISLLLRYLDAYADRPALAPVRADALAAHARALAFHGAAAAWADRLDLGRPASPKAWSVSISFTDHPTALWEWQLAESSRTIRLEVFSPPQGERNDTWRIHVARKDEGTTGSFRENDAAPARLLLGETWHEATVRPGLESFPSFLASVESFYGTRFRLDPPFQPSKTGLKRRDVAARLLRWIAAAPGA